MDRLGDGGACTDPLSEEALEWFVRLRDDERGPADDVRFACWLDLSPDHRQAYAEIEGLWSDLDAIPEPARLPRMLRGKTVRLPRRWIRRSGGVVAASLALLLAINAPQLWIAAIADEATARGEVRELMLADGTRVALDADSAIDVSIGADRRSIKLLKGRAWFDVAHEARPFTVALGDSQVRDIGTAFEAIARDGGGEVAVTEGVVELTSSGGRAVRLKEGQTARFGQAGPSRLVESTPGAAPWREGRLQFVDSRLEDVLGDLERYGARDSVILDREIGGRRITGVIDIAKPLEAQEAILARVGARGRRFGPWLFVTAD